MFSNPDFPALPARLRRLALALLIVGPLAAAHATQPIPAFAEVKAGTAPSVAVLLARDGTPLAERRVNPRVRRLEWVGLPHLSPALKEALLAAEDKRFFEHSGVDWRAFAGSLWHNLWYDRKRGASTLSMQLAGLLDPELALGRDGTPRRSIGQKWDQALAAQALEARWTKEQILEAYLNLAPFRGDLQGVHAASRAFFGKTPAELGRPEALVLAVLLRGPNAKADVVARRACVLAERIGSPSACGPAQRLADATLDRQHLGPRWELAPHLGRQLLQQPGERLVTTLDADVQRLTLAAVRRLGPGDAAAVVLDNASADVLAYVGAPDAAQADQAAILRSSGTLLLPFAYGIAVERRQITAATLLDDALSNHAPTAPDERIWVSARRALVENLAEPAASVLRLAGDQLPERLRLADLEVGRSGQADLGLIALAGLYRSLGSGGQWQAPRSVPGGERPARRLLKPEAGFIVGDILTEADTEGVPQPFVIRQFVPDGRETLVAGFSDRYTVVLWSAGARGVPAQANAAWHEILRGLHRSQPASRPAPPPGVVSSLVVFEPPVESPRKEWFIRGTEVERVALPRSLPRIAYPAAGMLVDAMALAGDPAYRIHFEGIRLPPGAWWRLNGDKVGNGNGTRGVGWRPVAGRHVLDLMAADGQVLDSVTFAVRAPLDSELSKPAEQQPDRQ
ncbi:transglycosylase domain-containing protein [Zoogloea sp.]|uniref:transglycosylase domain-containing protein n=1 Tax=Zoogloea sp. TaxID=49181 RepID=UPI0035AFB0F8